MAGRLTLILPATGVWQLEKTSRNRALTPGFRLQAPQKGWFKHRKLLEYAVMPFLTPGISRCFTQAGRIMHRMTAKASGTTPKKKNTSRFSRFLIRY